MSKYYNIKGIKVRVSDHEPNHSMNRMRGSNDIELYVKSVDNRLLSVVGQLENICDKRLLEIEDFQEVINNWKDGSYNKNVFKKKEDNTEDLSDGGNDNITKMKMDLAQKVSETLKKYSLSRFASHQEVKALSEKTGISQSKIKKHFGIY